MCCIALHNICIHRNDPCFPRWKLEIEELNLVRRASNRTQDKQLASDIREEPQNGYGHYIIIKFFYSSEHLMKNSFLLKDKLRLV